MPLEYGLVPEADSARVLGSLLCDLDGTRDRIGTGFVGTLSMMELMPRIDPERAYRLATQPDYPGWGFMALSGATTMWETWDGSASRNHPPFCLISAYFYKYLAGIRCDRAYPGFERFTVDPSVVGDLTFVEAWHDSPYGRIRSEWRRDGSRLTMKVSVPVGTTATIGVPTRDAAGVAESGRPVSGTDGVKFLRAAGGKAFYEVGSGSYVFTSRL